MALFFTHHGSVQPLPRLSLERLVVVVDGIEVLLEEQALAATLVEETITSTIEECDVVVVLEEEALVAVLEEESLGCE